MSVIVLAPDSQGNEQDRRAALQAGFDHHLTKPVDPSRLAAVLSKLDLKSNGETAGEPAGLTVLGEQAFPGEA